jgi:hypothetical protein
LPKILRDTTVPNRRAFHRWYAAKANMIAVNERRATQMLSTVVGTVNGADRHSAFTTELVSRLKKATQV